MWWLLSLRIFFLQGSWHAWQTCGCCALMQYQFPDLQGLWTTLLSQAWERIETISETGGKICVLCLYLTILCTRFTCKYYLLGIQIMYDALDNHTLPKWPSARLRFLPFQITLSILAGDDSVALLTRQLSRCDSDAYCGAKKKHCLWFVHHRYSIPGCSKALLQSEAGGSTSAHFDESWQWTFDPVPNNEVKEEQAQRHSKGTLLFVLPTSRVWHHNGSVWQMWLIVSL